MRALILLSVLAGCAYPESTPSPVAICPASVPIPAPLAGHPTPAKVGALEIRVELAREAERSRGDCWRAAFEGLRQ